MLRLKDLDILGSKAELALLPEGKLLINTINAHSYNTARKVGCSKFKYKSDTKSARIQLVKLLIFNTLYCQIVL